MFVIFAGQHVYKIGSFFDPSHPIHHILHLRLTWIPQICSMTCPPATSQEGYLWSVAAESDDGQWICAPGWTGQASWQIGVGDGKVGEVCVICPLFLGG